MTDSQSLTWELVRLGSLHTPMAIRVAATLHLCDHIKDGSTTIDDLAKATETHPGTLLRLLRHLVAVDILTVDDTHTHYGLTELGNVLTDNHPAGQRLWHDLDQVIAHADVSLMSLLDAVRTGEETYSKTYGMPFYDHLSANPQLRESFDTLFSFDRDIAFEAPAQAVDWSDVRQVLDLGGGTGGFITAIARHNPDIEFTLFELPTVIPAAREAIGQDGLTGRVTFLPGDFREEVPHGHDVIILAFVLHNWPDPDAQALLKRCSDAINEGGRIIVLEREDTAADSYNERFTELDIRTLVFLGGRLRLREEWADLAATAGLQVTAVKRIDNPSVPFDLSLLELERTPRRTT